MFYKYWVYFKLKVYSPVRDWVVDFVELNWVRLLIFLTGFIVGAWLWWYVKKYFVGNTITSYEIRLYVGIFLILCGVMTAAILRLYNAVVFNSGMMIRLKTEMQKMSSNIKMERQKLNAVSGKLNNTVSRFSHAITNAITNLKSKREKP